MINTEHESKRDREMLTKKLVLFLKIFRFFEHESKRDLEMLTKK